MHIGLFVNLKTSAPTQVMWVSPAMWTRPSPHDTDTASPVGSGSLSTMMWGSSVGETPVQTYNVQVNYNCDNLRGGSVI